MGTRTLLFALLFALPPALKPWLLRRFCGARIGKNVSIGWFASVMAREIEFGDYAEVRPLTLIRLDGVLRLGRQSEISSFTLIYGSSDLVIGDQSYVGPQCLINADEPVRIGTYSALGPRSMVFTHGSFLPFTQGYWVKLAGVTVGNYVWCAAGVFLHPGVEIGDECFVNSRSVVTQSLPAGSVAEGNPARVVQQMDAVRRKMSPRRVDAALQQVLRDFAKVTLEREMGITIIERSTSGLRFRWQGNDYAAGIVLSTSAPYKETPGRCGAIDILLVNNEQWDNGSPGYWFDVRQLTCPATAEPIHVALRLFMQRYYGMRFTLLR